MADQETTQLAFNIPGTVRRPQISQPRKHCGRKLPASFTVPPHPTVKALRKAGADPSPEWHADEATGRLLPIEQKEFADLLKRADEVELIRQRGLATAEAALKRMKERR